MATMAVLVGIQGIGVLYGGKQAMDTQKTVCEKSNEVRKSVNAFSVQMKEKNAQLLAENDKLADDIVTTADQIKGNIESLRIAMKKQHSTLIVIQVLLILSVVVVGVLFVLKRRGLLHFKLSSFYRSWRSRQKDL